MRVGIAVVGDGDRAVDAAALGDHDLAEQRVERVVAGELARAEAGAVDDDVAGLGGEVDHRRGARSRARSRRASHGRKRAGSTRGARNRHASGPPVTGAGARVDVDVRRPTTAMRRRGALVARDLVAGRATSTPAAGIGGERLEPARACARAHAATGRAGRRGTGTTRRRRPRTSWRPRRRRRRSARRGRAPRGRAPWSGRSPRRRRR